MPLTFENGRVKDWAVRRIGVIGPGIVGMPMAALLAHARICEGQDQPAKVLVVQRGSPTSGWKVEAINAGRSPIGGVEPALDAVVAESVAAGLLGATHDVGELRDADVVLVCVQTDKKGIEPDYGPLFDALEGLATALEARPHGNVPVVVFESTLAPSSMATVVKDLFARHGLVDGRDVLLGNSPNRVMPGRLVERVAAADKLAAGLHPDTPGLIARLYRRIVTRGTVHTTSSLTAEVVKTLENAYRDVRIAFAAEIVRFCDDHDVDFFLLRDEVNRRLSALDTASLDPTAVPTGGLLVPTVGVGGHCLPKDGVLLWWRRLEANDPAAARSLILESRRVNDESPAATLRLAERALGPMAGRRVALLGVAYRADSEDTRNSPTLTLARLLLDQGCEVVLHDPHVRPGDQNLLRRGLNDLFTRDLGLALSRAEVVFACQAHAEYLAQSERIVWSPPMTGFVDGCNLYKRAEFLGLPARPCGIGRGMRSPTRALIEFVVAGFRAVERGVAREVLDTCDFLNERYAETPFQRVDFAEVRRLAGTCATGCDIVAADPPDPVPPFEGFLPRLVAKSLGL